MARRRFNTVRRSQPNRGWSGTIATVEVAIPANSAVLLGSFAAPDNTVELTILRSVGFFSIGSDQSSATETQVGAIGMGIVTDNALAVGITAIPDPVTERDADIWFFYRSFGQRFLFKDATGTQHNDLQTYEFDSKAKRILRDDESIAIVIANAHGTHGLAVLFGIRILTMVRGTG